MAPRSCSHKWAFRRVAFIGDRFGSGICSRRLYSTGRRYFCIQNQSYRNFLQRHPVAFSGWFGFVCVCVCLYVVCVLVCLRDWLVVFLCFFLFEVTRTHQFSHYGATTYYETGHVRGDTLGYIMQDRSVRDTLRLYYTGPF